MLPSCEVILMTCIDRLPLHRPAPQPTLRSLLAVSQEHQPQPGLHPAGPVCAGCGDLAAADTEACFGECVCVLH